MAPNSQPVSFPGAFGSTLAARLDGPPGAPTPATSERQRRARRFA